MDLCWKNLPDDIFWHMIQFISDIDTRRAFKVGPKKLSIDKNFEFRSEIVYNKKTKTMWDRSDPSWILRKDIEFSSYRPEGLYIFNMGWDEYKWEIYRQDQVIFGPMVATTHVIIVNKQIKFV
jgi:hypothetical protein